MNDGPTRHDEAPDGVGGQGGRVRVRPREDADLPGCVRLLTEVHERDGYPLIWPERPVEWLVGSSPLAAWVALLDEMVVGHVALSHCRPGDVAPGLLRERDGGAHEGAPRPAVLGRLAVGPAARGRGAGTRLVTRAVEYARTHGLRPVLDVVDSDRSAVALYERLGWHRLGYVEQRWGADQTVTIHCYAAPD
ncbi:GNAT family N-acetyltransferase [Actinopolymorpha singaporensis]|uniref:Ribosomal protein S18 acetylase RimI n=1 Tax=Actinopolymorpha singaporensis TaxID=117157 RepID=A0A1H1NZ56_9ACTN|nr:GNAT family N-acetyltransferase [Actinopolymorpha singaporensis]SDS04055.1 Ribosomal protein S18 acetylase RimI [Actinopolymorpha singaporensis]